MTVDSGMRAITRTGLCLSAVWAIVAASSPAPTKETTAWVGTWAAAAQPARPPTPQSFENQTLRLIVHTSIGGTKARIRISNTYGDRPLVIGGARVARRTTDGDIDPASDRVLKFHGNTTISVPARAIMVSDPVDLYVAPLADLAISLFLPEPTTASTSHALAKQTNYISADSGDSTGVVKLAVGRKFRSMPFLTGVDVLASRGTAAIVAFGSSLTDGDGTRPDVSRRLPWPDLLAQRLHDDRGGRAELSVLNLGIIGNRLLTGSPHRLIMDGPETTISRFEGVLGEAGLARFDRDVMAQPGVKYVIVGLGINDIAFPGSLTPLTESVTADNLISGYRQIISVAHKKGVRVIGTTNAPFEDSFLDLGSGSPRVIFYTPEKEAVRVKVNKWVLNSGAFDGVIDFDAVVRDPSHPARLLPTYDSGDHIHPNDAGYNASANMIPLSLFGR
jgi:lysophospholipase L1-like esterase